MEGMAAAQKLKPKTARSHCWWAAEQTRNSFSFQNVMIDSAA